MKLTTAAFTLAIAALAAPPANAQQVSMAGPRITTLYGCEVGIACQLVTVTWGLSEFGPTGTVRIQTWFSNEWHAGHPLWTYVGPDPFMGFLGPSNNEYYSYSGFWMQPYFDEKFPLDPGAPWASPNDWRPDFGGTHVTYGTPAGTPGYGPYGASITLVQTPEPGSMILLLTGLGGVMLGSARRRKGKGRQTI